MEFEWDDAKSDRCLVERGFNFAAVVPAFADPARVIEEDLRYDYGEPRFRLFGRVEGRLFVVTFTMRSDVRRIISARKASRKENCRYGTRKIEE